jgi:uncharacterized protein (UPF0332 family)
VSAPITSEALLSIADTLARLDDPTTVARRRAVSSAYYALFHGLVAAAVSRTIGEDADRELDRHTVSRWYNHGDIRTVSLWAIRLSRGESVPTGVATLLGNPPPDLIELARAFIQLHEARHEADYDHTATVSEADARAAIGTANDALARLPVLAEDRAYRNYLALLLGGPRLAGR